MAPQRRQRGRRHLVAAAEENRVARAGRPGGGRHRVTGLVGADDDDVLGLGLQQALAELVDRVRDLGRGVAMQLIGVKSRGDRGAAGGVDLGIPGGPAALRVELRQRLRGRVGNRSAAADQHRHPGGRPGEHRCGDAGLPVVVRDEDRRLQRLRSGGRRMGGQGRRGSVGGRIGPTDPGGVPGRDQREPERPDRGLLGVVGCDRNGDHAGLAASSRRRGWSRPAPRRALRSAPRRRRSGRCCPGAAKA